MYNEERLIETYFDLIKINSITGNEKELVDYIKNIFKEIGLETILTYHGDSNSPSMHVNIEGEEGGPTILLTGHLDTVGIQEGWKTDPFEPVVDGDKVYGLGAMDMKGGIASIIEVVRIIIEEKIKFKGKIIVALVADEEYLSRGTYTLLKNGLKADMAIMAECRFDEMAIGFRGRYAIGVKVSGITAHASDYPNTGENAIINASKMAQGIENLPTKVHAELGEGTWCIRHIEGGVKNTLNVPDMCELFVDRYVVPGEDYELCKKQIQELAKNLGLENKISVELLPRGESPYMESFAIPKDHKLVTTMQEKYKDVVGKKLPLSYDKSVCDSNFLVQIGNIPTVTFGPSGSGMHSANESGRISQIKNSTEIYLSTIQDLLV